MNKKKIIGTSFLGIVGVIAAQAQDETNRSSQQALETLDNSKVRLIEVDPIAGNTCYGLPCEWEDEIDNSCDDAVIENNLQKLRQLNIVDVGALTPLTCIAYACAADNPEARQADKCEKAESLAKLVKLAEPLGVSIKP